MKLGNRHYYNNSSVRRRNPDFKLFLVQEKYCEKEHSGGNEMNVLASKLRLTEFDSYYYLLNSLNDYEVRTS